jgi:hypothetical protein
LLTLKKDQGASIMVSTTGKRILPGSTIIIFSRHHTRSAGKTIRLFTCQQEICHEQAETLLLSLRRQP